MISAENRNRCSYLIRIEMRITHHIPTKIKIVFRYFSDYLDF